MTIDLMLVEQRKKKGNASICAITMQASLYNVDSSNLHVDVKVSKSNNLREICVSFLD